MRLSYDAATPTPTHPAPATPPPSIYFAGAASTYVRAVHGGGGGGGGGFRFQRGCLRVSPPSPPTFTSELTVSFSFGLAAAGAAAYRATDHADAADAALGGGAGGCGYHRGGCGLAHALPPATATPTPTPPTPAPSVRTTSTRDADPCGDGDGGAVAPLTAPCAGAVAPRATDRADASGSSHRRGGRGRGPALPPATVLATPTPSVASITFRRGFSTSSASVVTPSNPPYVNAATDVAVNTVAILNDPGS